jgi:oxygen-independent coproporphyrinogen-3 oxidase
MSGFGIYVHWPFCAAKCPYCDFNSHVRHKPVDQERFAAAFEAEMAAMREKTGPRAVASIFLGGGTPSLMKPETVGAVLDAVAKNWTVPAGIEVTLEANPSSVEAERFRGYRAAGVNRVSLGVQALNDADLKMLGRLHNVREAKEALALACANFERVSFDLIYARPGQTPEQWQAELAEALSFGTEHLSLYQLTIEPATPFATLAREGKLIVPDDDHAAELYELTQAMTGAAGLPAYEISNHARPGAQSRHNLLYWRYGDYAGVGPGAHGRLSRDGTRHATQCERLPERWRAQVVERGHGITEFAGISDRDAAREHLLMALRLNEGLDIAQWRARWGAALDEAQLSQLAGDGFLSHRDGRIAATPKGVLVLNRLIAELAS